MSSRSFSSGSHEPKNKNRPTDLLASRANIYTDILFDPFFFLSISYNAAGSCRSWQSDQTFFSLWLLSCCSFPRLYIKVSPYKQKHVITLYLNQYVIIPLLIQLTGQPKILSRAKRKYFKSPALVLS